MIDIESKIISYREDTNDYRLCLTREEIDEIKNMKAEAIEEFSDMLTNEWGLDIILAKKTRKELKSFIISNAEQLMEQNK